MYETLEVEKHGGVAEVRLNRPEKLNAIDDQVVADLFRLIEAIRNDDSIRALFFIGTGRAFSAGADIEHFAGDPDPGRFLQFLDGIQGAFSAISEMPLPTIAAVNGMALGGGCELALACDFILMSQEAILGLPEIRLGLLPAAGGTQRLGRMLPPSLANAAILMGQSIDAAAAVRYGLANEVVASAALLPRARALASQLCGLSTPALRAGKMLLRAARNGELRAGLDAERQAVAILFTTPEARKGIRAFLDRRAGSSRNRTAPQE